MAHTACPTTCCTEATAPAELYPEADAREAQTLASFDSKLSYSVFFFALKGGAWLLIGLCLTLIATIQSFNGSFLSDCSWFTHGRVQAAAETALTFGWAGNAIAGLGFWLIVRLTRRQLPSPGLLIVSGIAWNLGVVAALLGTLLCGDQTNFAGFQAPVYAALIFAFSLFVFGAWALAALRGSGSDHTYISEWFLLVALAVFPWAYAAGLLTTSIFPGRGVVSALAASWTAHNVYALWLAPAALAILYYFLPKLSGRALPSYYLAIFGFWVWVIVSPWAGPASLMGGPIPVWITAVAGASILVSVMAYTLLASGFGLTLLNSSSDSENILPWMRFAGFAFFAHGALSLFPLFTDSAAFTHFPAGLRFIALIGVFTMAALGAFYYILPRLAGAALPCPGMARFHFQTSALAIVIGGFALCLGAGLSLGRAALQTHDGKAALDYSQLADMAQTSLAFQAGALLILFAGALTFHLQSIALWTRICPCLCALRSLRAS